LIGFIACLAAVVSTFWLSRRSLGHGLGLCLAWGYIYGVFRANHLDGFSHFLFDAAVLGLYAARLSRGRLPAARSPLRPMLVWVAALAAWPALLVLLPYDHVLINLVGLRVAVYYLPLFLVGIQAVDADLDRMAIWIAALNLLALGASVYELVRGIEALYPRNEVTQLVYATAIGEQSTHRIPAIFCTAHHYGGCMELSLPFLMAAFLRSRGLLRTGLLLAGMGAAGAGLLLCSCRSPVLGAAIAFAVYLVFQGKALLRPRFLIMAAAFAGAVAYTLAHGGSRTERFMELSDTEMIADRTGQIEDTAILPCMLEYPLGNGLAGAGGITIPYFLQDYASPRPLPGAESEYFRILLTQGVPGLLLWVGFLGWFFTRPLRQSRGAGGPAHYYFYGTALICMLMASRGVGLLYGVPVNCLLILGMSAFYRRCLPAPKPAAQPRPARQAVAAPLALQASTR
jgi:hypothetical protein